MKPVIPRNTESLSDIVLSKFPLARTWYRFLGDMLRTLTTHAHDGGDSAALALHFDGLEDNTLFTVAYASRVFTITAAEGAAVWVHGTRYPIAAGAYATTAHANTTGQYFCYYNASGVLTVSASAWDIMNTAQVAMVYYNATTTAHILFDERHPGPTGMSNATHKNNHFTRGTQLQSGGVVDGYTVPSTSTAEISYSVSAAVLADEDLVTTTAAVADGGPYRIAYRSGSDANGEWTFDDTSSTGILSDGTDIYYNSLSGGNWSRVAITTNNRWVNYWLVAWPTYGGTKGIIAVMGQTLHTSLASAQAADPSTAIAWGAFAPQEFVVFARLTYQRLTATTPSNAKLVEVVYIRSTRTSTVIPASAATGIATDTTNFDGSLTSADNTVQKALDTLDDARGYISNAFDNIMYSKLPMRQSAALTVTSGTAYFVYLGRTSRAITPKYVEFLVDVGGTGAQTAEIGLFSTPAPPNKASQSLTKLVSTATVDDLTSAGVKRNTNAFATAVAVGTYLWAGIRIAMATTQPDIWSIGGDMSQGAVLDTAGAGALTGAGPWTGAIIAVDPRQAPELRVSLA